MIENPRRFDGDLGKIPFSFKLILLQESFEVSETSKVLNQLYTALDKGSQILSSQQALR
jgi:hypothetical protein